jgi:hypothetical protein
MSSTFTRDPEPLVQYGGDGSRTTFPFAFPVLAGDDLLVFVGTAPATGFAITGIGDPEGGAVEFISAPAAGTTITLLRRTESIRDTAFVDGGPFRAAAINAELDRIMLLIQEDREEHGRALRAHPAETESDFCLPPTTARANKLLGFDSAGKPAVFGTGTLPAGGDASGALVTANGATTARTLGEHTAALVNVRDFGALGDGITDDSAAFAAAIIAAQSRGARIYVPASATPYLIGATLMLDGSTMQGDGAGSVLKAGLPSGAAIELAGTGAALLELRLLGSGASSWPASAAAVDLSAVTMDGVRIASGALDATVQGVEVAACATGLAVEGGVRTIVDCAFSYCRRGIEVRSGAARAIAVARTQIHACSVGLRTDGAAAFDQLAVHGGRISACGHGLNLLAPATAWRTVELSDLGFTRNLEADLEAGRRQTLALRGARLDESGKRNGTAVELNASGATTEAPNLIVETTFAKTTQVVSVQLSDGSNLNLLAPGDLIVLASDVDDVDDLWTSLKATRAGVVHKVNAQTASTATIELAAAADRPLLGAADVIRVVGRSGTAAVASVNAPAPAGTFTWLRADDHCRVLAANNPMPVGQIALEGPSADLRHFPGLNNQPVAISGVELQRQAVNGALIRLVTFVIPQDGAISFTPPSKIGLLHAFSHGALGDPAAAVLSYRADALGYTQIIAKSTYPVPAQSPAMSDVEVKQLTALTGTSGNANMFTFSAHTDGKIYVENRKVGAPRTVSLFIVGAPL